MIAGFEDLSDGEIHLCGGPVSIKSKNLYVPPEERGYRAWCSNRSRYGRT